MTDCNSQSDDVRLEILRRSPRDAKGNVIKARECGRPEDLKHLTFNEIRHLPLKRCLLCGYMCVDSLILLRCAY